MLLEFRHHTTDRGQHFAHPTKLLAEFDNKSTLLAKPSLASKRYQAELGNKLNLSFLRMVSILITMIQW
jgi:hypothetical protein